VQGGSRFGKPVRRGFVIGELLVALLLLAVAVSSLAALMYSVSRRPEAEAQEPVACVAKAGKLPATCAPGSAQSGASKLLRSGCATKVGTTARGCGDSVAGFDSLGETIVKSRTDSASLAMIKKQEAARTAPRRPDRGFIR
jgi:Tfp pilus assembly protein PilV